MEAHEMEERRWRREEEMENGLLQAGARSERIRLRPLLERCLAFLEDRTDGESPLCADLRRELGKEG